MRSKESVAEKRAARRFGEFARAVRRNLRRVHRIRHILERAEQAAHRCYEKVGVAMLAAKASSGMSEEAFAAWLASFDLSQDDLVKSLELGQVALDCRKAEATAREGPNERCPAATICQHRSNNLVPDLRLHVSKFVEDDAIEIRTT